MTFALIGGDDRFVRLARLLRADGRSVCPFALEKALADCPAQPRDALEAADVIILPLPCERGGALNAPLSESRYAPDAILRFAKKDALVCAGAPGAATGKACEDYGLELRDYAAREDFALRNADLTAEGALALLLDGPRALRSSRILITGYGRIGRSLAEKLTALGAHPVVAARRAPARTAAEIRGCETVPMALCAAPGYDAVVNTIPETVFAAREIESFGAARLIELASPPYGFSFAAAEALGKKVFLASGLPGKSAPETAAEAVKKTIFAIIEERRYDRPKTADRPGSDRVLLHL